MRIARTYVLAFSCLFPVFPLFAQQTATTTTQSSPQAVTLLQNSLAALTGGKPITDVTLSGNARRIVGPDDESGTATLKAISGDAGRMDLTLSSGQRSEILNSTTTPPAGSWSGTDAVSHPIASHNLLNGSAWFFPVFAVSHRLSDSSFVATYVGHETRNGQAVEHVTVSQSSSVQTPPGVPTLQHLTQADFFLDSTTLLPVAIAFNTHPDNDMILDIPVEIRFSDYRPVSGAQIPFHVEKFLNNTLLLDLQFTNAQLNSGLSASLFGAL